ncbi:Cochaperone prefoldin complex subunit [Savitreella phatthalungensis]
MSPGKPAVDQNVLQRRYDAYKSGLQQLASKLGDLETERDEHKLVLRALEQVNDTRTCFRMGGSGVLMKRTVADVRPTLETNTKGIEGVMDALMKQYHALEKEFAAFQRENNIKIVRG